SLNNLALLYGAQRQYARAEPLYRRALAIAEKSVGPDHPAVAATLNNLAELYRDNGQYAEAEPLYRRALATAEKTLGPDHADVAAIVDGMAALYRQLGRMTEAELLAIRAPRIRAIKRGKHWRPLGLRDLVTNDSDACPREHVAGWFVTADWPLLDEPVRPA